MCLCLWGWGWGGVITECVVKAQDLSFLTKAKFNLKTLAGSGKIEFARFFYDKREMKDSRGHLMHCPHS